VTLWARKRAPRAPHGPPFPTALSPEAEAALSLGDFFLSLLLYPFHSHSSRTSRSPPSTFIPTLVRRRRPHLDRRLRPLPPPPSPLRSRHLSPSSASATFVLPSSRAPILAARRHSSPSPRHTSRPSHIQPRHIPPSPRPLSLNSVLQCPAVAADQTHELIELICPYKDMVCLSCFSCVPSPSLFAFIDAFHSRI